MFIKTHSLDYFHGRLSIINTQNTKLLKQLEYYLSKILVKHDANYAMVTSKKYDDIINNAYLTYNIKGEAQDALTKHLFDVFIRPLNKNERDQFRELLRTHPNSLYLQLDEYEPELFLLHSITGYLNAREAANGIPVMYIKNYEYADHDFTAKNIYEYHFADGIRANSRDFFDLAKELATNRPVVALWKSRYHRDRMDLLIGLYALIRGKDHQGVILMQELDEPKHLLAKMNAALVKNK
jgi:hypothetical protein